MLEVGAFHPGPRQVPSCRESIGRGRGGGGVGTAKEASGDRGFLFYFSYMLEPHILPSINELIFVKTLKIAEKNVYNVTEC